MDKYNNEITKVMTVKRLAVWQRVASARGRPQCLYNGGCVLSAAVFKGSKYILKEFISNEIVFAVKDCTEQFKFPMKCFFRI